MKKYFMVGVMSLAVCTAAQAIPPQEYSDALDMLQKTYPVIQKVRQNCFFQDASKTHVGKHSSALEVFKEVLKEVIPIYLTKMSSNTYFHYVEGLDPVWKAVFGQLTLAEVK